MLFFSDVGLSRALTVLAQLMNTNGIDICLFTNPYTVVDGVILGDLTEAGFAGYSRVTLNNFSLPPTVTADVAATVNNLALFTNLDVVNADIYGYFVIDHTTTEFYFAENFPSLPLVVPPAGSVGIYPQMTTQNIS